MPVPDWVTDIPTVPYSPMLESFSVDSAALEPDSTDMQAGNLRMRNMYSVDIQEESIEISMTETQYQAFLTWVRNTLGRGTSKFTMPVPKGATFATKKCQIIQGQNGISRQYFGWFNGLVIWKVSFKRRVEDWIT